MRIARDQGQVVDLVLVDRPSQVDPAGLSHRRLAADGHRLADVADAELDVRDDGLAGAEGEARLLVLAEALELRRDGVAAERQQDRAIHALLVRDGGTRRAGVGVRHRGSRPAAPRRSRP